MTEIEELEQRVAQKIGFMESVVMAHRTVLFYLVQTDALQHGNPAGRVDDLLSRTLQTIDSMTQKTTDPEVQKVFAELKKGAKVELQNLFSGARSLVVSTTSSRSTPPKDEGIH